MACQPAGPANTLPQTLLAPHAGRHATMASHLSACQAVWRLSKPCPFLPWTPPALALAPASPAAAPASPAAAAVALEPATYAEGPATSRGMAAGGTSLMCGRCAAAVRPVPPLLARGRPLRPWSSATASARACPAVAAAAACGACWVAAGAGGGQGGACPRPSAASRCRSSSLPGLPRYRCSFPALGNWPGLNRVSRVGISHHSGVRICLWVWRLLPSAVVPCAGAAASARPHPSPPAEYTCTPAPPTPPTCVQRRDSRLPGPAQVQPEADGAHPAAAARTRQLP